MVKRGHNATEDQPTASEVDVYRMEIGSDSFDLEQQELRLSFLLSNVLVVRHVNFGHNA